MRRQPFRWAFVGGMVVMIIMFGIDLASHGVERIYGPLQSSEANQIGLVPSGQLKESATTTQIPVQQESSQYAADLEASQQPQQSRQYPLARPRLSVAEGERLNDRGEDIDEWAYNRHKQYAQYEAELMQKEQERLPGIPDMKVDSKVNQMADGTAGVLQSLSSQGIRFVVSFFESVTH